MSLEIVEESPDRLTKYASVDIGFRVTQIFDEQGVAALEHGVAVEPVAVRTPYWKDYDDYPGGGPAEWPAQFDVSRWIILSAYRDGYRVGGAALIVDEPRIELLRDCPGCALLWDLRVAPEMRGQGIGGALVHAAERRAVASGARALRVETQQVNVPACRFYQRRGFRLERVTHGAYASLPSEVQLLWRKQLP